MLIVVILKIKINYADFNFNQLDKIQITSAKVRSVLRKYQIPVIMKKATINKDKRKPGK